MPNPLDIARRYMSCAETGPGEVTCFYGDGEKALQVPLVIYWAREQLKASLSQTSKDTNALLSVLSRVQQLAPGSSMAQRLEELRRALRTVVVFRNDKPGRDTIRSLASSISRGWGDCVSLTVAMTALARTLWPKVNVLWRIGGDRNDPNQHIWPIIGGVVVDPSDPQPAAGTEIHYPLKREVTP